MLRQNEGKRANLEEYLFGDLDLPKDPPSLAHLSQITVRRRRLLQPDVPVATVANNR